MKQMLPRLWGNDALRERLGNDILARRLSHAYILEGRYGMGKHTLAMQIAAAQSCLCKDRDDLPLPCGTCKNCKKILEGKSPDVMLISREKGKVQMTVDVVRPIRTDVLTPPNDLDTKVYIIEDAHTMNVQAQNALLLTLEEPPEYVLFLLLCEDAGNLLETVRSRAPVYRLQPLPTHTVAEYLAKHSPNTAGAVSADAQEQVLMAAEGSIGRALDLLSPKQSAPILAAREAVIGLLDATLSKDAGILPALVPFGVKLSERQSTPKREEVALRLQTLMRALRDLIALKRCDPETLTLCFFTDREAAYEYALRFSTKELISLLTHAETAYDNIALHNANVRIAMLDMAIAAGIL